MTTDYIEYMMDRTISIYNDVKIMGIECLRNMYAASGLSIRPKTEISKNEQLTKEALSSPHRTLVDPWDN